MSAREKIGAGVALVVGGLILATGGYFGWRVYLRETPVVQGTSEPQAFALYDGALYVLRAGDPGTSLWRVPVAGASPRRLWAGNGEGRAIAVGSEGLLFSVCDQGGAVPCRGRSFFAAHGGSPRELHMPGVEEAADRLAIGGGRTYLVASGKLFAGPIGGSLGQISVPAALVRDVAANEDRVYWIDRDSLWRSDHRPIQPTELYKGFGSAEAIVVASDGIYVLDAHSALHQGSVLRFGWEGGAPRTIVKDLPTPRGLAVNEQDVFFLYEARSAKGTSTHLGRAPRRGGEAQSVRTVVGAPSLEAGDEGVFVQDGEALLRLDADDS